jgi:hypothetical protein
MSKVSRSDWAAQVPASGIIGVISAANLPTTPPSGVDMGSLTGKGFKVGQVPVWNGKKFIPADLPAPAGSVTFVSAEVLWAEHDLRPLESTTQGVVVPGVTLDSVVFVQNVALGDYVVLLAKVVAAGFINILATNINPAPITLLDGLYAIWIVN